jgi:FkbM family methyltransferase
MRTGQMPTKPAGNTALKMSGRQSLKFYSEYAFSKLVSTWFEVKSPKVEVFAYDFAWMLGRLLHRKRPNAPGFFKANQVTTKDGTLFIRPNSVDLLTASPSFERPDRRELRLILERLTVDEKKRVLFVDVGAGMGDYTVMVGNRFGRTGRLRIIALEPLPESAELLQKAVEVNGLASFTTVCTKAAYNRDGETLSLEVNQEDAGSSSVMSDGNSNVVRVESIQLDSLIQPVINEYDSIVMKIDIEGAEEFALRGAATTLEETEWYAVIEDFIRPDVASYLTDKGAEFQKKLTPYNSWWKAPSAVG